MDTAPFGVSTADFIVWGITFALTALTAWLLKHGWRVKTPPGLVHRTFNKHGMPTSGICPHGFDRTAHHYALRGYEQVETQGCGECLKELTPTQFTHITSCPSCWFVGAIPFGPIEEYFNLPPEQTIWVENDDGSVHLRKALEENWAETEYKVWGEGLRECKTKDLNLIRKFPVKPVVYRTCPSCAYTWFEH
ncbi:hypothetical protein SEA_CHILL_79 [Mycobacterium phage Chill]|uniref:Uncharacterized protein n=5 Tax=Plotvirus TaxID=2169613 RepID=A0A481VU15_9CAUD|nr:gp73 [Mycobacterium phage PBI1]ACD49660.1 hypothetical protein Adjutor_75 [Mycobacterium phage Adjutor]ACI06363.1 hypothetical protein BUTTERSCOTCH_75 [Mycobacterium phage Butterscotch]QBI97143.1 hypothetical protein SEA_CHILL_79 [Mycobacterium phage Chill]QBP30076.1 hypothetical protein SEA_WALDOWHY_79 [Mycobacterium phage WaldoWhy]ABD58489.1 hypothetical protein PBI_PBI1_73 [Mycobacterium phage PBI1]